MITTCYIIKGYDDFSGLYEMQKQSQTKPIQSQNLPAEAFGEGGQTQTNPISGRLKNVCFTVLFVLECYTVYKSESEKKMPVSFKTNSFIGSFAGRILSVFGRTQTKPTAEDLRRMEFKASTQHLGVRFTERVRDVFRFRWIRKF